jgi:proline dehydrogenase
MGTYNAAIQFLIRHAGSVYTAGPRAEHAQSVCERLGVESIASTVCYWNACFDSSRVVSDSYIRVLDVIRGLPCNCYLSVKAPAFGFDTGLLRKILDEAARTNITVHFDSLAPDTVDRTFALIDEARRIYPNIGCTLPARWRRSLGDVDRVIDLGLRVRVVKGQWAGLDGDETSPREGFLRVIDRLAVKRARHVAVATHNHAVAGDALRRLKTAGTSCELELLYALPQRRMLEIAREHNVPARVYVPCGHPGLPYRLKEVRRDPRILGWFVHDLIRSLRLVMRRKWITVGEADGDLLHRSLD